MLRKDVVEAIAAGKFPLYAVRTIDEGMEILAGKPMGQPGKDGKYPKDSVAALVDARLGALALGLKQFGEEQDKNKAKKKAAARK
jgi:hypothetical protein